MQPRSSRTKSVTFAAFELDLSAGELRHEGVRVRLQEQPFQILAMLLERPGEVVTREELRTRLWPSDTFVDFDHGLNKAVNKLRAALGDTSEHAQFVETLPRRGYRFLVSVYDGRQTSPQHGTVIDSIAVFSLSNPSPDPDTDYLAVGIPGSIIHRLSQIPGLRVIAWNSVAQVEDCDQDPLAIGRRLKAKAVLVGRIWQRESKLRLHLDLLDTESGEELWGDQYDRNLAEIFSVWDDIAREVSAKLRLKMTGEAERRLTRRYTENIEAYQLYVRARRWCETRSGEGFKKGIEYLRRAIEIDPNYALAHAEFAQCISVPCYYGTVDPHVAYPKARAAALRALEIDANLAEGHEVMATIFQNYDWNWPAAEEEYKKTIELDPNYAIGHYHYSYHLALLKRFDEAIREAHRRVAPIRSAAQRSPLSRSGAPHRLATLACS